MTPNEKIKEIADKIEQATAPLEEKVDSIWFKIGHSKWTWAVALSILAAVVFF